MTLEGKRAKPKTKVKNTLIITVLALMLIGVFWGIQKHNRSKEKPYSSVAIETKSKTSGGNNLEGNSNVHVGAFVEEKQENNEEYKNAQYEIYLAKAEEANLNGDLDMVVKYYQNALSYKNISLTQAKLELAQKDLNNRVNEQRRQVAKQQRETLYTKWVTEGEKAESEGNLTSAIIFYRTSLDYAERSLEIQMQERLEKLEKQAEFTKLLEEAKSKDREEKRIEALQLLEKVLVLTPTNPEAVALKMKIIAYYGAPVVIAPLDITKAKELQQQAADYYNLPIKKEVDLGFCEKMEFVFIPPGEFTMGDLSGRNRRSEKAHKVRITKGFYMGPKEVTQAQWKAVMGENPIGGTKADLLPVMYVHWDEGVEFCRRLSKKHGLNYRLPTEAEWEYACRAGTITPYNTGETISFKQANCFCDEGEKRKEPVLVGSFPFNTWGLYDMHGNVWEWCQDWWDEKYYENSPIDNPTGPESGKCHIIRGGSYTNVWVSCRSSDRGYVRNNDGWEHGGFRVVLETDKTPANFAQNIINETNRQEKEKRDKFNKLLEEAKSKDNKLAGKQALEQLEKALELYPNNVEALALKSKIERYYSLPVVVCPFDTTEAKKLQQQIAEYYGLTVNKKVVLGGDIQMDFVLVPPGEFTMQWSGRNKGMYRASISKGFYMAVTETTQAQWKAVMGNNPSGFEGDNLPVERVSWRDVQDFCQRLSRVKNEQYRLPTEEEWEYACRAGTWTAFNTGETISHNQANYGDYFGKTTPVGSFPPNAWGLYDMHGNVWEVCQDGSEHSRVQRGGSWYISMPPSSSHGHRSSQGIDERTDRYGFRLILELGN